MNHIDFIEKNVRELLIKQGFSSSVAQGVAWQAIDLYKRMSQASKKGAIFDDVMRHAKAWADKQVSKTEVTKCKRTQPKNQGGLF
ncbi:hypothetical protein [Citrobacter freundii]